MVGKNIDETNDTGLFIIFLMSRLLLCMLENVHSKWFKTFLTIYENKWMPLMTQLFCKFSIKPKE